MTTEAPSPLPGELHELPTWTPDAREIADLELLLSGALAPLTGFLATDDVSAVEADGRLADGTPWPAPVTLTVPEWRPGTPGVVLTDPEATPLAVLEVTESRRLASGWRLAGPVRPLRPPAHGPFRHLHRTPAQVRAALPAGPVLAVATRAPLHRRRIGQVRHMADTLGATALVLPLATGPHAVTLIRAVLAARPELPASAVVVPVPLAARDDPDRDLRLRAHVAAAYGATHLLADTEPAGKTPIPVVVPGPWTFDTSVEVWRPAERVAVDDRREEPTEDELTGLLDTGAEIPDWFTPPAVARVLASARPPRRRRGLTMLLTGLSGSGKSTIARGVADALVERGRTVTLLDGDMVRRLLSAGLTFSRADRDLNVRRIGYVAAEVTRHGGVAICAPIAPYAATRAEVRQMVSEVGDFLLIHVATPLAVCEARDHKGLYAKARAGLIPEFTGVSAPYEPPSDADLVVDAAKVTPQEAVASVLDLLESGGWIAPEDH